MIQDIYPHRYDNQFKVKVLSEDAWVVFSEKRQILVKFIGEEIELPKGADIAPGDRESAQYLFSIDGEDYFFINKKDAQVPEGFEFASVEIMRDARPKFRAFACVTAMQLIGWYRSHVFCGRCGSKMVHSDKERMLQCPECRMMEYPKISPATIIAVKHGNKLLLSKYAGRVYKKYALLAGFAEIGEMIEETVVREVMEEVGLKVKNVTYYKSQPWSFSDTLLLGFFCDLDGDESITLDQEELAMAEWFEREEIPVERDDCSLTNEMIMAFKEGLIK